MQEIAETRRGADDGPGTEPMAVAAYRTIRELILSNTWAPGFQATEQEVGTRLGMSRTPVREALMRLQQEGLVSVVPRHGVKVLPISPTDMKEIYEILTSLESTAAELVARRKPTAAQLRRMERASADMESALERDDLEGWAKADESFHAQLLDLCGNEKLKAVVLNFWDRAHRARLLTLRLRPKPERSTKEHAALVEAIRRGDHAEARRIHFEHRERAGQELVELLQRLGLKQL